MQYKRFTVIFMTYIQLTFLHLVTVLPAFLIGTIILFKTKGTSLHKKFGKVYLLLMLVTAFITLFMPAAVGPRFLGHFGFIHLLSLLVFYVTPKAIFAIRRGDVKTHRNSMIGMYIGALLIAGFLAFMPGRLLHTWLFR